MTEEEIKENFGDKLQKKLADMTTNAEQKQADNIAALNQIVKEAKAKFDENDSRHQNLYDQLTAKFAELDANVGKTGHSDKKCGFLPEKMMVPKPFKDDIGTWRKWKNEVAKYFDEAKEGMKKVMDEVSQHAEAITAEVMERVCAMNPNAPVKQLQEWKLHLIK